VDCFRLKVFFIMLGGLLFSKYTHSKVLDVWVGNQSSQHYLAKEICAHSGIRDVMLATVIDHHYVDCMGKKISTKNFCLSKKSTKFLRTIGFIEENKIVCHYGSQVRLTLSCTRQYRKFCQNSKKACQQLRGVYAHDLRLDHHGVGPSEGRSENLLRCHFSS